jgi:ElaB/YqjD/DUF883 family membrane-anchored ribosome-binding protein
MEANIARSDEGLGCKMAGIGEEAARLKEIVSETFEGGVDNAKRALKRGRRSAEDALDSASYQIKRHPLESLGVTFGVGLVCGLAVGYMARRNSK